MIFAPDGRTRAREWLEESRCVVAPCARRNGSGTNRRGQSGGGPRGLGGGAKPPVPFPTIAGLRARYKASLGITLVGSDVDAWADQSGNGNHLTAPGASNRPAWLASVAAFGGKPAVQGDGVAEWLERATFDFGGTLSNLSFYFIIRIDTPTASRRWMQYTPQGILVRHTAGAFVEFLATGAGGATSTGTTALTTAAPAWARLTPGSTQSVGTGATQEDSDANTLAVPADDSAITFFAGAAGAVPAAITTAEILVTAGGAALTAPELVELDTYAALEYGV